VARVEDIAASAGVELLAHAGPGGVRGDAAGLAEALGNIVLNAIQSTPAGGAVFVANNEQSDGSQLWVVQDAAQARFRRSSVAKRGRPAGTGKAPSVLSRLLRCGTCGGGMNVVSRKWKNGIGYARFGCTAHYARGSAICANAITVSEKRARDVILAAIKELLESPDAYEAFASEFRRRGAERLAEGRSERTDVDREIRESEKRIANLTEAIARVGWSDAVAAKLAEEERRLEKLEGARAEAKRTTGAVGLRALPDAAAIQGCFRSLFELLEQDPVKGREALAHHVRPIVLTPEEDGASRGYRVTGAFNFASTLRAATAGAGGFGKSSCAGGIRWLDNEVFQGSGRRSCRRP
jgi:hypothetical protein